MSRKFLVFAPQESRLGPQAIDPTEVWRICRNVEHPQLTDLFSRADPQFILTVQHPLEVVAKALDIQLVEVVNPKTPKDPKEWTQISS